MILKGYIDLFCKSTNKTNGEPDRFLFHFEVTVLTKNKDNKSVEYKEKMSPAHILRPQFMIQASQTSYAEKDYVLTN